MLFYHESHKAQSVMVLGKLPYTRILLKYVTSIHKVKSPRYGGHEAIEEVGRDGVKVVVVQKGFGF